jgi:nitroreductase
MTDQQFYDLCHRRRSIRYFGNAPVPRNKIERLLEIAHMAPSVENVQPWKFHVVTNEKLRHELTKNCCYGNFVDGADTFIVITVDRSASVRAKETLWNPRELDYSCMVALSYLQLAATAMDLGSCIVSLHHGPVHELLDLPQEEAVVAGIMIGNIKDSEKTPSDGHERRKLSDMVEWYE